MIDAIIYYGALTLLHGTVLALVTWILSVTLLRRCLSAFKAALWTMVLIKFLIAPALHGQMAFSSWSVITISVVKHSIAVSIPLVDRIGAESTTRSVEDRTAESVPGHFVRRGVIASYFGVVVLLAIWSVVAYRRTRRRAMALTLAENEIADEIEV